MRFDPLCAVTAERPAAHDKISSTAAVIAASTVFFARDAVAGHLVPANAARLSARFLDALPKPARSFLNAMSSGSLRFLGPMLERATVPGIQVHYALRKRHIEETARRFIREGGEQVVVLGGGFDTLAVRLADEYQHVRFIEVDQQPTQQIKMNALGERAHNPRFVPLDVASTTLDKALRSVLDTSERALFIAEGLLMYLPRASVEALFATVSQLAPAGSRFLFTFMERDAQGRIAFRNQGLLVDRWLRLRGEQFAWGIERDEVAEFVAPFGFHVRETSTSPELRARYLPNDPQLPVAVGECVCVAERL